MFSNCDSLRDTASKLIGIFETSVCRMKGRHVDDSFPVPTPPSFRVTEVGPTLKILKSIKFYHRCRWIECS